MTMDSRDTEESKLGLDAIDTACAPDGQTRPPGGEFDRGESERARWDGVLRTN